MRSTKIETISKSTDDNISVYSVAIYTEEYISGNGYFCDFSPFQKPGQCVSLKFLELSKIFSQNLSLQKSYFVWEFQAETLCVHPKPCFGHKYKVSAWSSQHKSDYDNSQLYSDASHHRI